MLDRETEAPAGSAAAEHADIDARAGDAVLESHRCSTRVAAESSTSAAAEHADIDARADDALLETDRSSSQVAAESSTAEHACAEFSFEVAMAETLHRINSIIADIGILVKIVDHACYSEQCVSYSLTEMC